MYNFKFILAFDLLRPNEIRTEFNYINRTEKLKIQIDDKYKPVNKSYNILSRVKCESDR
jgi:hypothetical protein